MFFCVIGIKKVGKLLKINRCFKKVLTTPVFTLKKNPLKSMI